MKLIGHRHVRHAAHYLYDHPARGHDLEVWTIEATAMPTAADLERLGVAADASYESGHVEAGRQRYSFAAVRPMSEGTCERCQPDEIDPPTCYLIVWPDPRDESDAYWCGEGNGHDGQGWSAERAAALEFATTDAARVARRAMRHQPRQLLVIEDVQGASS